MTYRLDSAWPANAHAAEEFLEELAHKVKAYATTGREWEWTRCCGRPVHILVSRMGTASAKCWSCLREERRTPPSSMLPAPRLMLWALSLMMAPWVGRYHESPVRRRRYLARNPLPCEKCRGLGARALVAAEDPTSDILWVTCTACDGRRVQAGSSGRRRAGPVSPCYVAESYSPCDGCKREQLDCDLNGNCNPGHDEDLYEVRAG